MKNIDVACWAGLITLGWVASKFHTYASGLWMPVKDHENTVREVFANAQIAVVSGIQIEEEL